MAITGNDRIRVASIGLRCKGCDRVAGTIFPDRTRYDLLSPLQAPVEDGTRYSSLKQAMEAAADQLTCCVRAAA